MIIDIAYRARRRADVQTRRLDGETLVLDRTGGLIHQLNETATFVWTRCTGDRSLIAIACEVAEAFEVDLEVAARDVETMVTQFHTLRLLDTGADVRGSSTAA